MRILAVLLFLCGVLLGFQNCGSEHTIDKSSTTGGVSIQSVYTYTTKPKYFDNVQLIAIQNVSGGFNYQFIASIVLADNPAQSIDVRYTFNNSSGGLVCPRVMATVNRGNNHIEIASCQSTTQQTSMNIIVEAKLPTATNYEAVAQYPFRIQ